MVRARCWVLAALAVGVAPLAAAGRVQVARAVLGRPLNSALVMPAGEGLGLLYAAEPLGAGRFRVRSRNQSQPVTLGELGTGRSHTGQHALAYGLTSGLDVSLVVPFLLDSVGGLNKYGTGDPVVGLKYSRPGTVPASFYLAYQLLLGLPLGYKGEHGLDEYDGGVRPFSTPGLDLGLQVLMDMGFRYGTVHLNGGYFRSGDAAVLPELVYGVGVELGRRSRWGSVYAEYLTRIAFAQQSRGAAALAVGARLSLWRGVQLEVAREYGFLDHPADQLVVAGLRLHGQLTGGRRLQSRHVLYRPPPRPPRLYAPDQVVRVAVVEFAGFEALNAGSRVVARLRQQLAPHDSLELVDLRRYADVPHHGFLKPAEALALARRLGVDVVVTGQLEAYDVERLAGTHVPLLLRLPEARARLRLRYRVLEFSQDKNEMQAHIDYVDGAAQQSKRPRLLPADERDVTVSATARELEDVQERAITALADNLLAALAARFAWVPPDFLP